MKKKVCNKCKIEKPLSEFANDRSSKTKKTTQCKQCMKDYKKKRKEQEIVAFDFFS